jgi:DNA-binding CsgD family transcriptional regulator
MRRISSFVDGLSVGDDADRLGISESTARNHLGGVYRRRLGVRPQRELLELLAEPPRP